EAARAVGARTLALGEEPARVGRAARPAVRAHSSRKSAANGLGQFGLIDVVEVGDVDARLYQRLRKSWDVSGVECSSGEAREDERAAVCARNDHRLVPVLT